MSEYIGIMYVNGFLVAFIHYNRFDFFLPASVVIMIQDGPILRYSNQKCN